MSLEYYIRVYDNFLTNQECDLLCQQDGWVSHEWTDGKGNTVRKDNDLYISYLSSEYRYIVERFGEPTLQYSLDTNGAAPQFGNTNLITSSCEPRLNKYYKGQHMDPHSDLIRNICGEGVPVLSSIVMLNDSYKGGELLFNLKPENKKVSYKLNKGSIIIWPSTFLYEHEVTPVIEGERVSMVTWFW